MAKCADWDAPMIGKLSRASRKILVVSLASFLDLVSNGAGAAIRHVTNCGNDGTPGTLGKEVVLADAGDIIDMSALTCRRIVVNNGGFAIFRDLVILGPGRDALTLDATHSSRVFDVIGSTTRFSAAELTISNGAVTDYAAQGACIYSEGSVELINVAVTGCIATGENSALGGGIFSKNLVLVRSTVSDNLAYGKLANGGGLAVNGDLVMHDSFVGGNEARPPPDASYTSFGGGVLVGSNYGTVIITGSTISGNHSSSAAGMAFRSGIPNAGPVSIVNSTISSNTASEQVGGIYSTMPIEVVATTIAFNSATTGPGNAGLHVVDADAYVHASIISNNMVAGNASDFSMAGPRAICDGDLNIIASSNIALPNRTIAEDPLLLPLAWYGGPTPTHAIPPNSPAIDRAYPSISFFNDQRGRGFNRVVGNGEDLGAFEYQGDALFANSFE